MIQVRLPGTVAGLPPDIARAAEHHVLAVRARIALGIVDKGDARVGDFHPGMGLEAADRLDAAAVARVELLLIAVDDAADQAGVIAEEGGQLIDTNTGDFEEFRDAQTGKDS